MCGGLQSDMDPYKLMLLTTGVVLVVAVLTWAWMDLGIRYRYDSEQHRVLRVFQQFNPDNRGMNAQQRWCTMGVRQTPIGDPLKPGSCMQCTGRIKAKHFQLLAYESGCLLTQKMVRCVASPRSHREPCSHAARSTHPSICGLNLPLSPTPRCEHRQTALRLLVLPKPGSTTVRARSTPMLMRWVALNWTAMR